MNKGFLGVTGHWVQVEVLEELNARNNLKQLWTLRAAVIGCKNISGGHDRDNMGRYLVGLTDRVGITGRKFSKVCLFPMDSVDLITTSYRS